MLEILENRSVPGASLAIAKDGKLILARGYGLANVEAGQPVQPTDLFNLASCSKPFTAVAILKLVEEGKVRLDDRVFDLLKEVKPPPKGQVDPQVLTITLRQLLQHSSGLERRPFQKRNFRSLEAYVGACMTRPLLFPPGTEVKYSNLGYLVPRLVVQQVTGVGYERYVQEQVLRPMGIRDMVIEGNEKYVPGEVRRYEGDGQQPAVIDRNSIIPVSGCWRASAVDLVRFLTALDGTRGKPFLSPTIMKQMLAAPPPPIPRRKNGSYFGLGWDAVTPTEEGVLFQKNGGIRGISTFVEHLPNGVDWAVCFNGNGSDEDEETDHHKAPYPPIKQAIERTGRWPSGIDLFEKYPSRPRSEADSDRELPSRDR